MTAPELPRSGTGCVRWVVFAIVGIIIAFLLLPVSSRNIWVLELNYHLIAGSILHAARAISHFAADPSRLLSAATLPCMAATVALWGAHRLILWWWLANGNRDAWHFRHTALAGSLLSLGSAAAIALSGVFHELAWLPQGKIIRSNTRSELMMATNCARQLGLMLFEYETEHGSFPQSLLDLEELALDTRTLQRTVFIDVGSEGPPEPFILLKPGGNAAGNPSQLVVIGPRMAENSDFVVLKLDNSVSRKRAEQFIEVVKSAAAGNTGGK
jgi:hypothetical protein